MESNELFIKTNDVNTNVTDRIFMDYWKSCTDPFDREFFSKEKTIAEIKDIFLDFYYSVPFIQNCASADRKYAKDLERDNKGRIIVDITHPHILEDMDFFRPTARCFEEHGVPTLLKPNGNPNSPYGKWIAEEARRCREGYVRESDGEWVTGDLYFFWNYSPMLVEEEDEEEGITVRSRRFPSVWEGHYLKAHYIWQARHNSKNSAELASRAKGKAHPYNQIVYTPEGKKLWGDIQIGDKLFGNDGKITKVTHIPFDAEEDIYTVTLADGRQLQCTTGHLFYVKDNRKHPSMRVTTLLEIMESDYAHKRKDGGTEYYYSIPKNGKVDFPNQKVLIDPYTLGLLLGDGSLSRSSANTAEFTSKDEDILLYQKQIPYKIKKHKSRYSYGIKIPNLRECLNSYELWNTTSDNKFIPKEYLFNTIDIRKAVLQGLLDTDGTVNNNGVPMFTTASKKLAEDVRWLCYSLGYNNTMFVKQGKYKDSKGIHICKLSYNITILTNDNIFRLPRKLSKLNGFKTSYSKSRRDWTRIVNIEYSHREKAKCVVVDNESHCYLIGDFIVTHNTAFAAAMLCRRILLGETSKNTTDVTAVAMASDKKFLTGGDVLLDKFQDTLDFCAESTEFPRGRLKDTENELKWEIGYKRNNGPKDGIQNVVFGITSGNTPKKGRGSRASLYILEEFGSWANLKPVYNGLKPSVKNGKKSYGIIHMQGTAGDSESDFSGAQDLVRNPDGNDLYALENVYDKVAQGKKRFVYFFPGYINLQGYYDENGNSDVVRALVEIIANRVKVKYNTDNPDTLVRLMAETPIVPEEAMLRVQSNVFPTTELNTRIAEIEGDPNALNDVFVGEMTMDASGNVGFKTTSDVPIRFFPHKDNRLKGAVEIFEMPQKAPNESRPAPNRYIASCDPVDKDSADSVSLSSTFVLDMFTDRIVAEYTGRKDFAEDCYEVTRRLCMFYNARCLYENNISGLYGYFAKMNCTYLLVDTPDYLKEKDLVKTSGVGNTSKGVRTTVPIINHGEQLIRDWLCKEVIVNNQTENSEELHKTLNLYFIKNLALLKELSQYNRFNNFDRVMSLIMLMIYRESMLITFHGEVKPSRQRNDPNYLGNSKFFQQYDRKFRKN